MSSIDHPSNIINSIMLTEQSGVPSTPPAGKQQLYVTSASEVKIVKSSGVSVPINVIMSTPASASATGIVGTVCFDSDYIYCCVATNTWKRVQINAWP
jgi:hypothetical protein